MRLAELHWRMSVGDALALEVVAAPASEAPAAADIVVGAGFAVQRVDKRTVHARRIVSLPDTIAPRMRALVVGLNPSVYSAERGVGFARGTNRFWKALLMAGLATRERDGRHALLVHGIGMTDLCKRATVASSELGRREYVAGATRVEGIVRWMRPNLVAFVGLEGWRAAIDPSAVAGLQPSPFGGRPAYVLPSTSGLNAHTRLDDLVAHFHEVARLAAQPPRGRLPT